MPHFLGDMEAGDIYHDISSLKRPKRYPSPPGQSKLFQPCEKVEIQLATPSLGSGKSLWSVISKRRSIRHYLRIGLSLKEIGQVLWACQGMRKSSVPYPFRTSPSAGNLYPIESYVFVKQAKGLVDGVWRYEPERHGLRLYLEGDAWPNIASSCLDQKAVRETSFLIVLVAEAKICEMKYGVRAYRYLYLEAGHICQNIYLAAEGLGLGCCAIGAFFDREVSDLLELDIEDEKVLYIATVGVPERSHGDTYVIS